jgi:hypothetical protein
VEALKQQVLELKKKLKKNKNSRRSQHSSRPKTRNRLERSLSSDSSSVSVEETEEEESSVGEIKGEEVRVGGQEATGPNFPRWRDIHTGKEGNRKQYEKPSTKYHTLLFRKK